MDQIISWLLGPFLPTERREWWFTVNDGLLENLLTALGLLSNNTNVCSKKIHQRTVFRL